MTDNKTCTDNIAVN